MLENASADLGAEWDRRYGEWGRLFSGRANPALVAEVEGLATGRALDVGCGEGGDAIWLASRGWDVTALDVSQVALDRAATEARKSAVSVAWVRSALVGAPVDVGGYDLVTVHYPALLRTTARDAERALLAAVAPNGLLLVVHHADVDAEESKAHGFDPEDYVDHDDVVAALTDGWRIEIDERRARDTPAGPASRHPHDLVLLARRN